MELESQILKYLNENDIIEDSGKFALSLKLDHKIVIGKL